MLNLDSSIRLFYPQKNYENKKNFLLLEDGKGAFCEFSVDCEPELGVYFFVVDNEVVYVGETNNLRKRINSGYGKISPRNCYIKGQSTNCRLNKAILKYAQVDKIVKLCFYPTSDYKKIEREIFKKIKTKHNKKND